MRTPHQINRDAKLLGQQVSNNQRNDNSAIQILCAYIEELAEAVDDLERKVRQLEAS